MQRPRSIILAALVSVSLAGGARAQAPGEGDESGLYAHTYTDEEIDSELGRIPGLLIEGSYDLATELLNSIWPAVQDDPNRLRTVYLLLIKTHVTRGNYFAYRLRERETAKLFYREADKLVLECLRDPRLGGVVLSLSEDYPPEMVGAFERIRSENFGSFRILSLAPPHASVEIDGVFVPRASGGGNSMIRDLAVGPHEIVIRSEGYREIQDTFQISPNSTLERRYELAKSKSPMWYLSRGAAVVAAGTLAWILIDNGSGSESPLPGPPPPPPE